MSKANWFSHVPVAATRTALALGVVVTLGALDAATPAAAQGAWCAQYSGESGGTNCGFYTIQQCQEAVSGVGGFCGPSPWAHTNYAQQRRGAPRRNW
jgi:uncharacterized protein DUF3551